MISDETIIEYMKRTGAVIQYAEPGNMLIMEIADGLPLLVPSDETDAGFLAKLDETERTGKNAFITAYKRVNPHPDEKAVY